CGRRGHDRQHERGATGPVAAQEPEHSEREDGGADELRKVGGAKSAPIGGAVEARGPRPREGDEIGEARAPRGDRGERDPTALPTANRVRVVEVGRPPDRRGHRGTERGEAREGGERGEFPAASRAR